MDRRNGRAADQRAGQGLRMALPSKGLEEATLDFLSACGLRVNRTNPRQYRATIPALPGAQVLFQRANDIFAKVDEGSVDLGVTGYDIVREHALDAAPLREVEAALKLFGAHGGRADNVTVDLSLGRGLRYYTGLVFEVYYDEPGGPLQLCGGGRYDELVRALGGREAVPACGFSFGLERLKLALDSRAADACASSVDLLMAPVEADDVPLAAELAERPHQLVVAAAAA